MRPMVVPSTTTDALETRCRTARIGAASSLMRGTSCADNPVVEAAQSPWPALGALLVRDGAITPAQLEAALEEKRREPAKRIGEILVAQGVATRTQIARVLAEQHELPFVELNAMMIESEQDMTGGGMSGIQVASKTGTAEHGVDSKNTPPHGWYVAFAPADDPKVAVAVLVENGGDKGLAATGATIAAPIGHEVIAAALGTGS